MEGNLVVNSRNGCGCHSLLLSWDLRFSRPGTGTIPRRLVATRGNQNVGASLDVRLDLHGLAPFGPLKLSTLKAEYPATIWAKGYCCARGGNIRSASFQIRFDFHGL